MKRVIRAGLVICCILLFIPVLSLYRIKADDTQTVTVAVINYDNYIQMDNDGGVSGYAFEYLQDIKQYTDWNYDYVEMSFAEAAKAVEEGKVDILVGCQYTEERAAKCDFSEESMGDGGSVLIALPDNEEYMFNDFESFDKMKVAVLKGTARRLQTEEFLKDYGVSFDFVEFETDDEAKAALNDGQVEAVLMSSIRCDSNYKIIARFDKAPLYFMLNKNKPELKTSIDYAMTQIHLMDPYYDAHLNEKYYGDVQTETSYTKEELEYIHSNPEIIVAISANMAPMEYYDEEDKCFKGIVVDTYDELSECTGLQFKFVERKSVEEVKAAMNDGKVTILGSVANLPDIASVLNVKLSNDFNQNTTSVITNDKISDYLSEDNRVVIVNSFPLYTEIADTYGYQNIFYEDSFEECVEDVNKGIYDMTFIPTYSLDVLVNHAYYSHLNAFALPDSTYGYCAGISYTADERLISIINKGLQTLTEEQKSAVIINNLSECRNNESTRDFVYKYSRIIMIIGLCVLTILSAFAIRVSIVRRKNNEKLVKAIERADAANVAKSEFLSRVSHDLRTPMNAIISFSGEALRENITTAQMSEYMDKINSSGNYLLGLINDVLDMSKIESGKFELHEEMVDGNIFLQSLLNMMSAVAGKKNIKIIADFSKARTKNVYMDRMRSKQIYVNLLNNAIKFSEPGSTIEWKIEDRIINDTTMEMVCSIKDHGCGMSREFQKKVFEPFEQEHNSYNDSQDGTGLGLSIVKSIIEKMGGTITVESEMGVGSTFSFTLRRKIEPESFATDIKEIEVDYDIFNGRHILVCEDNSINAMIARKLLEKYKVNVDVAANGQIGCDMFEASESGYYDAVLMDIHMPVMDGLDATRHIRAMDRTDSRMVPIIAMTANAFDDDVKKSMEAGINRHLAKPIDTAAMYSTLYQYISKYDKERGKQ